MPKLLTKESRRKYREFNDIRRNLRNMSLEDIEHYVKTGKIRTSKGKRKYC